MPADRSPLAQRLRVPAVADPPAPHLGLTWRPLAADDGPAVAELNARCAAVDHPVSPTEVMPAPAQARDSLGGFSATGQLEALATVSVVPGTVDVLSAVLAATIAPGWRGRGLGRALLDWQDARARQLLAEDGRDLPARLCAYVEEHLTDRRRLYVAGGFSPKRVVQVMRRELTGPLPAVDPPTGVRITGWTAGLDETVRGLHNAAFAEHWGFESLGPEAWLRLRREIEPRWSAVAVAAGPDGSPEVVGYAVTGRHERSWPVLGFTEGYTDILGVRRDHRGRGVARALLATVLRALGADRIDSAGLDVDTVDGAPEMFTELGYRRVGARILYTVEL